MIVPLLALMLAVPQGNPPRIPVAFTCTCADSLSHRYATKIRDLLATSPRYIEVPSSAKKSDGKTDAYEWKVGIVSIVDDGTTEEPHAIALSVAITFDGFLMMHFVQTCGTLKIDECASQIFADLDSEVHEMGN